MIIASFSKKSASTDWVQLCTPMSEKERKDGWKKQYAWLPTTVPSIGGSKRTLILFAEYEESWWGRIRFRRLVGAEYELGLLMH